MTTEQLAVKRAAELRDDEDLVEVRATAAVRVNAGAGFECHAPAVGAMGIVTRAEFRQFLEPTGYFEEVS